MDKYFPFSIPRWAVLASLSHGFSKCPMGFFLAHIGVQVNNSSQCRLFISSVLTLHPAVLLPGTISQRNLPALKPLAQGLLFREPRLRHLSIPSFLLSHLLEIDASSKTQSVCVHMKFGVSAGFCWVALTQRNGISPRVIHGSGQKR